MPSVNLIDAWEDENRLNQLFFLNLMDEMLPLTERQRAKRGRNPKAIQLLGSSVERLDQPSSSWHAQFILKRQFENRPIALPVCQ